MRIDIFSDTICPWCFIGKRRLEKAIESRGEEVEIHWRAFQLNPEMPSAGMDRTEYLERKFGGPEGASQVYSRIEEVGRSEALNFAFDRISRTPNTVDSHRLVRFATNIGKQEELVERLFQAYFTEGANIGDRKQLAEIAVEVGLDRAEVEEFLAGEDLKEEILAEDLFARQQGIQGVPCFIFDGRYAVSGAQDPEVLMKVMDSLNAAAAEQSASE
ncbi:DsbA family oxidoreductase [Limibacillus halophilus]|uniref:Putative DsbA family dithiol-disulfide isomerase n=1 Tax=Limibacillus halophilus TaxID=1579333 RepID=A0A839SRW3_9PROT|nr:DsbA family oxidoreductase [Limibacillus halophilus]MBB3065617.1 putative DsbA family dithiol-disulfide isomerase [Limibacillus halophilus]